MNINAFLRSCEAAGATSVDVPGTLPTPSDDASLTAAPTTKSDLDAVFAAPGGEARMLALSVLRDPIYRANLLHAARTRELPAAVEVALWHYAFGKPVDHVEVGKPGTFTSLSSSELAARARALAAEIESTTEAS